MKGKRPDTSKREQLLNMYTATKQQISYVLRSSEDENFGVRQEYRITISLLREVEEEKLSSSSSAANNESSAGGVENHSYNYFWILNTRDINAFTATQLNR